MFTYFIFTLCGQWLKVYRHLCLKGLIETCSNQAVLIPEKRLLQPIIHEVAGAPATLIIQEDGAMYLISGFSA
jgi:hypothetical protein